jgi:NADH-quinone oxidoreductase subunit E
MNSLEDKAEKLLQTLPSQRQHLILFLHLVQQELGFIPEEVLPLAARHFSVSPSEIFGVVTFYSAFRLKPGCQHEIVVCQGTACHVRGAEAIMDEFSRLLGVKPSEENLQKGIWLKSVNCLGCCAIGPVVVVDGQYQAKVNIKDVEKIAEKLIGKNEVK